jgi:N-acetylglucosaminyl-diphospho-decaprenol L-rhamnosyltransferase
VKVSIVIVNYNVKELILKCLYSIDKYSSNREEMEIIVVDNNSSDDSVSEIKRTFPDVIVIENKTNDGFPIANNQAFKIAKGEFIFMLNPDTELLNDGILQLSAFLDENPNIAMVAPKLFNTDRSLQKSFWRFPKLKYIIAEDYYLKPLIKEKYYEDKDINNMFEVESVSGAAMFFRRTLFDSIGMLDEKLFWIEDIDYCYRIVKNNNKIVYLPSIQIVHHIGQSAKKNYNISISNQIYNKIKFFDKHYSKTKTILLKYHNFIFVLFKIITFGILSPFKKMYFLKTKAYIYTLRRVFNPPTGIK